MQAYLAVKDNFSKTLLLEASDVWPSKKPLDGWMLNIWRLSSGYRVSKETELKLQTYIHHFYILADGVILKAHLYDTILSYDCQSDVCD